MSFKSYAGVDLTMKLDVVGSFPKHFRAICLQIS
jgi:hypothetical protein